MQLVEISGVTSDAQVEHLAQDFAEAVRSHRRRLPTSLSRGATGDLAHKPIDFIRLDLRRLARSRSEHDQSNVPSRFRACYVHSSNGGSKLNG